MRSIPFDNLFGAIPPALIIQTDAPTYTLLKANEAYLKATRSCSHDIIGKSLFNTFPHNSYPDSGDIGGIDTALKWVIEKKTAYCLPARRYDIPITGSNDFEQRYLVANHSPIFDEKGEVKYICQTIMDVTSAVHLAKEDQVALEVAESKRKQLYSLFMQAPVGIGVFLGADYVVDMINPTLARLYGRTTDELLGKPIFDVLTTVKGAGFEQFLDNVRKTGQPYVGTEAMLPLIRDGQVENVFSNFVYEPFRDETDQIIGVVAVAVDVTNEVIANRKLQESEQRLNMALQNSEAGVFDTDLKTGITVHSLRNAQIFGYSDNHWEWTVEKFMDHVHPKDRERIRQEYQASLDSGNVDLTMRITRTDGVTRWINIIGKHIFDKDHKPLRCVGTTLDITEKKELEKQKDQFISMVSHELKTPLTSIKAYSDLIAKFLPNGATEKNKEFLSRMQSQICRIEGLIRDLLDVSRMENGKLLLHRTKFELNTMLTELVNDLQMVNHTHKLIVTQNDSATVFADQDKLIQVITNLINNAVKYSPKSDKVLISLSCHQNHVIFSVQDFGVGIPKENHTRVFDRFHQLSNVKQFSGLGLGLYISREIIHSEGGEIWLESVIGQGCIFYFTLPADKTSCN